MCSKSMTTGNYSKDFPIFGIRTALRCLCLAVLLSFCLSVSPCSAAEPSYTITEQELTQLEWNLNELEKINNANSRELSELRAALKKSQETSGTLKFELRELNEDNERLASLLEAADKSLQKFAAEEERKREKIKRQRTFAYILAGGLLLAYVGK